MQILLDQTLEIERAGGLMLPDGSRRTPSGVFFYLLRTSITPKERAKILRPPPAPAPVQPQAETQEAAPVPEANG